MVTVCMMAILIIMVKEDNGNIINNYNEDGTSNGDCRCYKW